MKDFVEKSFHVRNMSKSNKGIASNFAEEYANPKKWYEELPEEPANVPKVSDEILFELKNEAKKCNDAEVAAYSIKNSKTNSDYQWMKTVMSKGTISDKIAAYTLLIQDDPICNLPTLRNMINMVKVGKKKECLQVIDTLSELFLSDLLRPDSKLKTFHDRPLAKVDELTSGNSAGRRKYLSIWYFEDQLKECYFTFIQALNTVTHDTVDANKEKAIGAMYKLLAGNPEQEKNLLAHIVNKLGDPSQKVASKAIYCLGQLLYAHSNMKQVVLNEIERLLFRPNISTKAQYYGICFLSQFCLNHEDFEVAKNLITVYFAFFKGCIKKGDVDSRMMSALLVGVNRAYPYAQTELRKVSEHIDTMYKVVHISTFNISLHALNLLYQVSNYNNSINDRFYSALYRKLLDPEVATTKHQALFLNLIFRSLKRDTNPNRIRAFIKRLLQVAVNMLPAMACGILYLTQHLVRKNKHLLALTFEPDAILIEDEQPEHYNDVKLSDDEAKDDVNLEQDTDESKNNLKDEEDIKPDVSELNASLEIGSSWNHSEKTIKKEFNHPEIKSYNPLQRNPLYAGGEFCVYLELLNLQKHFHPTVALFANKILNSENISYSGDPLKDFTLNKFLERFAFKNPKKAGDIQKSGINPVFGKRKLIVPAGIKSFGINSKSYLNLNQNKIPVEELFMYTYLQRKQKDKETKVKEEEDDSDIESVASDEFEEMLNKMSGSKDLDDENLDFMNDVGETLKQSKKGKKKNEEYSEDEDDEEEDEIDDNLSDDDVADDDINVSDDNEGFEEGPDDDDEDLDLDDEEFASDLEIDDEEIDEDIFEEKGNTKKGKNNKNKMESVFASADEFASILDEDNDFMSGTANAVSNKDNANVKQLAWEQKRDHWLKGYKHAVGKGGKRYFDKGKQFNKKRPGSNQTGNKNKKAKKR